jgi:hypothetical protein
MTVSYNEGNLSYMRELAAKQGISVAELTKRRRLDEEYGTYENSNFEPIIGKHSSNRGLNLGVATQSEFEPIVGSNAGIKAPTHQDTSHIGAEERATGSAVGGTVGGIVAAMMGLPPSVGVAAGSALGSGGSVGETATSALGATADEIKPGDEGKIKDFLKKGTDVPDVWGHPAR